MAPLPIDPLLPRVVGTLESRTALVIEAAPGAGKTTRVPQALLDSALGGRGEILVLEPRRLPARLAAGFVARQRGERVGETVGYTVRFAEAAGPRTRLRFVTEGILLRRLITDPTLQGVTAVVLDEFHERHLAADLGLAWLRRMQRTERTDLRLVVMSATLEAEPLRAYLGDCPLLRSEGRQYPVEIEHQGQTDERPLADQVAGAVRRLVLEGEGDVLVFLPGAAEIRRAAEALGPLAASKDLLVLPLHGDLPPAEQDRAVSPALQRKVILSTNVAETSVTIEGVSAVVDSGLARIATHSPWTGLPTLSVMKISQAAAIQRAGRAGRTGPGRAVRLYTRHDFEGRRAYELPEVQRLDLADAVLTLHALGVTRPAEFPWFEPPDAAALSAADELLRRLDAIGADGRLTDIGREILRLPLHPRLGRLVAEGVRRGAGAAAATLAAIVSEGDISDAGRGRPREHDSADLLERLDRFENARAAGFARDRLRGLGVDGRAAEAVERARRQLGGLLRAGERMPSGEARDEVLAIATLTAFPDRVLRRRAPGAAAGVLATGGAAEVGPLPPGELLVAVEVEDRRAAGGRKSSGGVRVRLAVGIEPEWLLDLFSDELAQTDELVWNPQTERVDRLSRLCYGHITLDESRGPAAASPEASRLLAEAASRGWPPGREAFAILAARLEVLRQAYPDDDLPDAGPERLAQALSAACEGLTSLAELGTLGAERLWAAWLPPRVLERLRTEAPERVRLPGGRELPVHYQPGTPPWIESRLQDFFGMRAGPVIARGRVPLTLHLLAPNGRAVQVTRDLEGFWRQHYPAIRRELGRRYPRHAWPDDGASASPPARRR